MLGLKLNYVRKRGPLSPKLKHGNGCSFTYRMSSEWRLIYLERVMQIKCMLLSIGWTHEIIGIL